MYTYHLYSSLVGLFPTSPITQATAETLNFTELLLSLALPTCTVGEVVPMEFAQFVALDVSGVPWGFADSEKQKSLSIRKRDSNSSWTSTG